MTAKARRRQQNLPAVVEPPAERGADIGVWNQVNKFGWTPLTIAEGCRFGNFKPSPVTVDALRRVMLAAGVPPPTGPFSGKGRQIY